MRSIKQAIRTTLLVSGSFVLALGYPLAALADDAVTTPTTTTADTATTPSTTTEPVSTTPPTPDPVNTESTTPPETQVTNLSPSTEAPTKPDTTYTYDAATGHWNTNSWVYDPASGTYKAVVAPAPSTPLVGTGPSAPQAVIDSSTASAIANALSSTALTGDASVIKNTTGGSALTGDAASVATVINNVNSSLTSATNQQAANFVSNVMGDVNGDIMLQPMLLKAMLEAAAQPSSSTTMNSTNTTGVTNDLNLSATSGDATVASNTKAGDATSGSANTVANVVNLVNSMIAANQSFVGTINIYGNLNGDILIAPDFIPKLLASNGGDSSSAAPVGTASISSTNNETVVNNIALAAKTGEALVSGNTGAGDATTGTAATNTVIFNLTNHEVVASNSLLVFVNVLGRWVGVIIDAPTGATAAAIGDGVTKNSVAPNLVIDATNTTAITNNINLSSLSGNATVARNTFGGSALTGDATASANVANVVGNNIGLSGWFGVLFINVFGSWIGSFGLNTSAGDPIIRSAGETHSESATQPLRVIEFVPRGIRQSPAATIIQKGAVIQPVINTENEATDEGGTQANQSTPKMSSPDALGQGGAELINSLNLPMLFGSLILVGGSIAGLKRVA
jgi:glucoamylase